jgi:GAF domain-containing protein
MASERSAKQLRAIIRTQTEIAASDLPGDEAARRSLSGRCVLEGQVLRSDNTAEDPRVDAEACRRVNAASMLCVPLAHRGETVGVLKVYSPLTHHFDDGDVETLELLSELIAAHISHANLYEAEALRSRRDRLTGLPNRRALRRTPRGRARPRSALRPPPLPLPP